MRNVTQNNDKSQLTKVSLKTLQSHSVASFFLEYLLSTTKVS